ncbi:MAG TPA: DUF6537 domain-containing protein, partial [Nocardioides sp.]|nr:DUF6537 domain-containing protein [Nocardioides sp.]
LRQLGMKNKIRFGTWFDPALRALRASRRLRGTKLDPFGYALVRRTERALADEYEQAMRTILEHLTLAGLDHALKAAESPDLVRGYEHIKLDSVPQFREQLSDAVVAASNPVST